MEQIAKFFREASNEELVDLFNTFDISEIFYKYTEKYIISTIEHYLQD